MARQALTRQAHKSSPDIAISDLNPNYFERLEDSVVAGVERWMFEQDLQRGDGGELKPQRNAPPKFHATFSSAALAVNNFAPWRGEPELLPLAGIRGFEKLEFERPCSHGLPNSRKPNLDFVAENDRFVAAVESKCTEYLRRKEAKFASKYETLVNRLFEPGWLSVLRLLQRDSHAFDHLDAAQLVKHYLGLRHTFPNQKVTLLYLFWEPANADDFDAFRRHRTEQKRLIDMTSGSSVQLTVLSYAELWAEWDLEREPSWLSGHLANLRTRYEVAI